MKKNAIAILIAMLILTSSLASALFMRVAIAGEDPADWYSGVNGVLKNDTYSLYPYVAENFKVGFSKFGELINSNTNIGLEYADDRDPFAPIAGATVDETFLPKKVWINGWFIDIYYNHSSWGLRNVWAGALFADLVDYGRPWLRVDNDYGSCLYEWQEEFNLPGRELNATGYPVGTELYNGGRKTNGTAVTEPLTILYNGPRLFVAKLVTHVYDFYEPTSKPLHIVDITFTIIFNKVKKEVIVLKDVKFVPSAKYQITNLILQVDGNNYSIPYGLLCQFSNREEWDLGYEKAGTTKYSSYVHFYVAGNGEGQSTVYNRDWTMLPTLPAHTKILGVSVNRYGGQPGTGVPATYDVAQIIANDLAYVGWHAFWPSVSDWSADAGRRLLWYKEILDADPHDTDSSTSPNDEPFRSPLIVGEWDFLLSDEKREPGGGIVANVQFRGVSVYGITDLNDGDDSDMGAGHSNILDTELLYQLNEIFNPWDLYSAVEKETKRWVEFTFGPTYTTKRKPALVVSDAEWDDYCVFSERIIDLNTSTLLKRGTDYNIRQDGNGAAYITGLLSNHYYKILYSTKPHITGSKTTSLTKTNATLTINETTLSDSWTDWLGVTHSFTVTLDTLAINLTDPSVNCTGTAQLIMKWNETDFKVFVGETYVSTIQDVAGPVNCTFRNATEHITGWVLLDVDKLEKAMTDSHDASVTYPLARETVHALYLNHTLNVTITFSHTVNEDQTQINSTTLIATMQVDYEEKLGGRYEWTIVGRDAKSVDSAGAALVTAAFKNKQIEIGLAGADMYDSVASMQMPWVMSKIGAGYTRENYYYSGTDYRTALKDDWCKTWPIASSNIIVEAGPRANVLAWYGNDFAQAFFGLSEFATYAPWDTKIIPLTCWNTTKNRVYASTGTTGYAVISTYKDINGTVLFMVWGYNGIDTYYVSKWFHEEGIYQLQEAPLGLTAIIVKITYSSTAEGYKPTAYSIVECLGTISETEWTHGSTIKGGIHDP